MANETITNVDLGSVALGGDVSHEDAPVKFAGAAVLAEGTILARGTSDGKYIPYVKGGSSDGNGVPAAVATYDIEATGAGDIQSRVLVAGKVRTQRLIIDADGDASNVDGAVRDLLRGRSIIAVDSEDLSVLDNQ